MSFQYKTLKVNQYNIYVGDLANAWAANVNLSIYSQVFIIVDKNTNQHCLPIFLQKTGLTNTKVAIVEAGETYKNTSTCTLIWQQMLDAQLDRKALCINLGGGVIGDMGGFCAATFKRGIDFIQVPTTLLSQVDSSIGGKLGIDFHGVKNCIGVFEDPKAVFIDAVFLNTLSLREIRSGFAEMLKHSLIADENEWHRLRSIKDLTKVNWIDFILVSLEIKRDVVEKDPFEKNIRKSLNFGHTIGHAIESHFLESENRLLHGEAIAIGIVCESFLAYKKGFLSFSALDAITMTIRQLYDWIELPNECFYELIALMQQDKKNENSTINFTLLNKIGQFEINQSVSDEWIIESFEFINLMTSRSIV